MIRDRLNYDEGKINAIPDPVLRRNFTSRDHAMAKKERRCNRNDPFYTPRLDRGVAGHERMEKSVEIPGNSSISGRAHHLLPGRIAPACSSPSPNRRKVCIRPSEFSGDEQLLRRRPLGSFHRLRNPGITCLFEGII